MEFCAKVLWAGDLVLEQAKRVSVFMRDQGLNDTKKAEDVGGCFNLSTARLCRTFK